MVELVAGLLGRKKEKPQDPPIESLRDQEFIKRMEREISEIKWTANVSRVLNYITRAELEERSPIKNNLGLYMLLAEKATDKAGEYAGKLNYQSSENAIRMQVCVDVSTECTRRIHDSLRKDREE